MKKMIAGFLAVLLVSFVAPVRAQNVPTNLYVNSVGGPGLTLNSGGATYGQICSAAASSSWSLSYGSTALTCGTAALTFDSTPLVTANAPLATAKTAITGIQVTTNVVASSSYETVVSTGGVVTLTSTPNIAAGVSGQWLVISSTATGMGVTFQDEGTLTGSKLQLGAASRAITQYKTLTLIYDAADGFWREISYGSN